MTEIRRWAAADAAHLKLRICPHPATDRHVGTTKPGEARWCLHQGTHNHSKTDDPSQSLQHSYIYLVQCYTRDVESESTMMSMKHR